jgi:hypothetical protein
MREVSFVDEESLCCIPRLETLWLAVCAKDGDVEPKSSFEQFDTCREF